MLEYCVGQFHFGVIFRFSSIGGIGFLNFSLRFYVIYSFHFHFCEKRIDVSVRELRIIVWKIKLTAFFLFSQYVPEVMGLYWRLQFSVSGNTADIAFPAQRSYVHCEIKFKIFKFRRRRTSDWLRAGRPRGSRIFSSPLRPDRVWDPPNLLANGYRALFPWG
jgi:hypothetical protein